MQMNDTQTTLAAAGGGEAGNHLADLVVAHCGHLIEVLVQ
jgi:hypothetical protein